MKTENKLKEEFKSTENQGEKDKKRKPGVRQWIYGILSVLLVLLFVYWTGYWVTLFLIPIFIDIYITKRIHWAKWKEVKNPKLRIVLEWVDAIGFALVGIYFLNIFVIQNYQIPTSSLEKSLLVGDFLCVSKFSYGGRSPMTPFSLPLMQHTIPFFGGKSYLDNPQVDYERFGNMDIKRNDIVVFNYPSGDTVALNHQDQDYYMLCHFYGRDKVWSTPAEFGKIVYRPVDRRENYVKRCIGLPGETIELRNDSVLIDGKYIPNPKNSEQKYCIQTDGTAISPAVFTDLGISEDDKKVQSMQDISQQDSTLLTALGFKVNNGNGGLLYQNVNLTNEMVETLKKKPFVLTIMRLNEFLKRKTAIDNTPNEQPVYPLGYDMNTPSGDFPKLWIPKKGATIKFDDKVDYKVAAYARCIKNYEHNDFEYRGGKVYINGKQSDSYTFKYDYFFMMGDNRDNSADSRSWGFVPEDHVVGKPLFVWLSIDKDTGSIRWDRLFTGGNKQ